MPNNLEITVVKQNNELVFYADMFPKNRNDIFQTANEITFRQVQLYEQDDGKGLFSLSIEQAKELAKDILNNCN